MENIIKERLAYLEKAIDDEITIRLRQLKKEN